MRALSFLKQIASANHDRRRASKIKRALRTQRSQLRRRSVACAAIERLESRRLFVADLVTFLTSEHVDINLQRTGAEWSIGPRNSDEDPPVQYANDEAVMYVGKPA
ncbi:MAG: hypothetical protein IT423_12310, partial [Pirellulaceae bacterium]|nr:hypothetical protein [Pirellulaceae bacterium]